MRHIRSAVELLGCTFALALFITAIWSAVNAPPVPVKAMQAPVEITDYTTVLRKAYQDQAPRIIPTERIVVAPEVTPVEATPTQTAERQEPERSAAAEPPDLRPMPKLKPRTQHDICRGKGKRYISKHKWRCRR